MAGNFMPTLPLRFSSLEAMREGELTVVDGVVDGDGLALVDRELETVNAALAENATLRADREKMRKALAFLSEHAVFDPLGAVTQDEFNDVMADAARLSALPAKPEDSSHG